MFEMKKIHSDERGEIYSIPLSDKEDIALIQTNKGYARGGHIHPDDDEYFIVVKGLIRLWVSETQELYHQGMSECIPHGCRHFFVSITDSIIIHWGADEKKRVEDKEYRDHVTGTNMEQTMERRKKYE